MPSRTRSPKQKPRELRRRLMLPARMRTSAGWSDACILNVSSRGLLVHTRLATPDGATVELCHGEHVIIARVVWRQGPRRLGRGGPGADRADLDARPDGSAPA